MTEHRGRTKTVVPGTPCARCKVKPRAMYMSGARAGMAMSYCQECRSDKALERRLARYDAPKCVICGKPATTKGERKGTYSQYCFRDKVRMKDAKKSQVHIPFSSKMNMVPPPPKIVSINEVSTNEAKLNAAITIEGALSMLTAEEVREVLSLIINRHR